MAWVNEPNPALAVLFAAMLAPVLTVIVGFWEPRRVSVVAVISTALAFLVALWGATGEGGNWSGTWIQAWDARFAVSLDGLASMYALLATGIGLLVVLYAAGYMPLHREHTGQHPIDDVRFYGFLLLFMAAMVGLAMSQDLLLLFVFWDITAIASFFLIGFDREDEEARESALMALLVTGISAIGVLVGAVLLWTQYGTFSLQILFQDAEPTSRVTWAVSLILAGALAKSAQFPFHFWLPRAMAAPTPVSSYLHSAAMVAAGVYLIGRIYPLVALDDRLLDALVLIGGASMVVGGGVALTRDSFKQVLAYSTISQYGYVVVLFGLGGHYGVGGATFYVIAHAIAKSALFMTAGAVTEATGASALGTVGGLARRMPVLAIGSGFAAMAMMALPLTIGFFKDELFFAAATENGRWMQVFAVLGAALSFAYIGRWWRGIFLGDDACESRPVPGLLVWPIVLLGATAVVGGIVAEPFVDVAQKAATVTAGYEIDLHPAYHLNAQPENVMALAAFALGSVVMFTEGVWSAALRAVVSTVGWFGPARTYVYLLRGSNRLSDSIHRFEVRDLRSRIATILAPAGILVAMAVVVTPTQDAFKVGDVSRGDLPLIMMVTAAAVSGVIVTLPRDHLRLALTLSCVGFSLAVVYAFLGSPDVALVAVLIETLFSVVFFGMLVLMPRSILRYETNLRPERRRVSRDAALALIAGVMAFLVAWGTLSRPSASMTVIEKQSEQTPLAHGYDVVTVILADFRGFDTMGEITVIAIAFLGIISLIRAGRLR